MFQNKTYVYAYDKGGNRERETTYAFTLGDALGEAIETKISEYNYWVWKDRLSSFNGNTVKYDSAGNPTSYDDKTLTWDGRNLKEIALADGSKTQFEYDADGLRTQKRQFDENGDLQYFVDYIWEDGKLQYQYVTLIVYVTYKGVTTAHKLGPFTSKVIYDESGLPQGFMVNDAAQYAFVRNLQGDVIAIIDQDGETVMEYSYDPWGNIEYHLNDTFENEQDAMLFTALCPLTYRGYNYDFTTGLYYLQSRYYNPEWGRFINCDDTNILLATQGETHNANLFAYCANNPVNRVDYSGYESESVDGITAFVYALYLIGFLDYEMEQRGLSYILYYDYNMFMCGYDLKYNQLFVSFEFYNINNFVQEYYQISVSVILKKDLWQYRCDLYNKANSKWYIIAGVGLNIIGLTNPVLGVVAGAVSVGLAVSASAKNKEVEELTAVLYQSNADDNDMVGIVSPVYYIKENNLLFQPVKPPTITESMERIAKSHATWTWGKKTYIFAPSLKRITV